MSAKTGIEWCDATWNPVVGCSKVSAGCKHCYAKALHDQRYDAMQRGLPQAPQYAQPFEVVQLKPERLKYPISWRKPRKIFVNSVSDLFHEDVPDEYIDRVFATMAIASHHVYQVLTKRAERMRTYVRALGTPAGYARLEKAAGEIGYSIRFEGIPLVSWPIPSVWLGVSVENQRFADERIPLLLDTPAAKRFLSCEPLLGAVSIADAIGRGWFGPPVPIDWVIVGGESGKGARPMQEQWARDIRDECVHLGSAFFFKQLGGETNKRGHDDALLDGVRHTAFPEVAHA